MSTSELSQAAPTADTLPSPPTPPLAPPQVFESERVFPYTHRWAEGNIVDEVSFAIRPMERNHAAHYIAAIKLIIPIDKQGKPGHVETLGAEDAVADVFKVICYQDPPTPEQAPSHVLGLPVEEQATVLNRTLLNLVAERPLFQRGDERAPAPGETVIRLTCWHGQQPVWAEPEPGQVERPAVIEGYEDLFVTTQLYFRTPKAKERTEWDEANDKHSFETDAKGKVTAKHSKIDINRVNKLLFGSETEAIQPLFLRGTGYRGAVPFHHVYYAAAELFRRDIELGKFSSKPARQS